MKNLFGLLVALLFSVSLNAQHVKGEILFTGTGLTVGIAENIYNGKIEKSIHDSKVKQFEVFDIVVMENGKNVSSDYSYSFRLRKYENSQAFDSEFHFSSNVFMDGTPAPRVNNGVYLIEILKRGTEEIVYSTRLTISNGRMQIL